MKINPLRYQYMDILNDQENQNNFYSFHVFSFFVKIGQFERVIFYRKAPRKPLVLTRG